MSPTIEALPDEGVVVRGLTVDVVQARLVPRPAHRPGRPAVPLAELVAAVRELQHYQLPVTRTDIAAAVTDGDRRRLGRDLAIAFPGVDDPWAELLDFCAHGPRMMGS